MDVDGFSSLATTIAIIFEAVPHPSLSPSITQILHLNDVDPPRVTEQDFQFPVVRRSGEKEKDDF